MANYDVDCDCGRTISVTAAAAGTSVTCRCGRAVSVPRLSEMRESAGAGAFESGVVDRIRRLVRERDINLSPCCLISDRPTSHRAWLQLECERRWVRDPRKGEFIPHLIMSILVPFWSLRRLIWSPDSDPQEFGHDIVVDLPLPIDPEFKHQLTKFSQRKLKELIRTVPEYVELLNEYPKARVLIGD